MKTHENIKLINGLYSSEKAKEVLVNVINSKIQFHALQSLTAWEKDGFKDIEINKRLLELKQARERIIKLFDHLDDTIDCVEMKASIDITFISK
jgi:dihydroorotase